MLQLGRIVATFTVVCLAFLGLVLLLPSLHLRVHRLVQERRRLQTGPVYHGGSVVQGANDTSTANVPCSAVTEANNKACYDAISAALSKDGFQADPAVYAEYPQMFLNPTRNDVQYVLFQKDHSGSQCPPPCAGAYESATCVDVSPNTPGACYVNTRWAYEHGLQEKPWLYKDFTGLDENTSFANWQWVLHTMLGNPTGTGWACPMPCSSTGTLSWGLAPVTITSPAPPAVATGSAVPASTTVAPSDDSSLPFWWPFLLLALLVCLCCGGCIFLCYNVYLHHHTEHKQTSRGLVAMSKEGGMDSMMSNPTYHTGQMTQTHWVPANPSPQYQYNYTVMPVRPNSMNMYDPAYQHASALFDQLDRNHDGFISRAEFAQGMGPQV